MKRRSWTKFEIDFLKNNFKSMSAKKLSEYLSRPEASIHHKAQRLGLSHGRWWTKGEVSLLKKLYGNFSKKEIAIELGRTELSVNSMAVKVGIAKVFEYPPERFCVDCGKKLANKYTGPERCSECNYKHNSGSNNPMWKGGVSSLYKMIQRMLWKPWKFPIMERDNFICQVCGYHGKDLEVHHERRLVDIRKSIIKSNKHLSIEIFEERVLLAKLIIEDHSLRDGVTLCRSCHKSIHASKSGELLETPNALGEDNQQPSRPNVLDFVGRKVQRLTGEDAQSDKPDTSARHALAESAMR